MPGLDPGIHEAYQRAISLLEIAPLRIGRVHQIKLPGARPMFDVLLALDRQRRVIVFFEMNELLEAVCFGEACNGTCAVLLRTPHQIVRYSDVQCAAWLIREDIDVILCHRESHHGLPGQARQ
jgi:hypothetical protein